MTTFTEEIIEAPPLLSDITARDICGLAAEYIEEHGWVQGWLELYGQVCTVGALRRVVGMCDVPDTLSPLYPSYVEARNLVAEATNSGVVHRAGGMDGDKIPEWNDRPERTQAEVVSVLRSVANG